MEMTINHFWWYSILNLKLNSANVVQLNMCTCYATVRTQKNNTFVERIALDNMFGNDIQKVYSCKTTASNLCHYVLPSTKLNTG